MGCFKSVHIPQLKGYSRGLYYVCHLVQLLVCIGLLCKTRIQGVSRYITCQNVTSGSFDQSADILDIFHIHNAWSHCGAEFMVYTRFFYYLDGTLDFIRQCRILHRGEHRIFLRHCLYIHSYKVRLKAQDPVRECAVCIYLEQVAHILDCLGQLAQIFVYKGLATGYADTLQKIVMRSSGILGVPIDFEAAGEIASRSRGTPRIANALLRRVRDFAQVKGNGRIDLQIARIALEALNIDRYGLDEIDNKILTTIINKFQGGPVGINTIATAVGEDAGTVEEVYEPFLIKEGFIKRTPRGREVTELAYRHLHISPSKDGYVQGDLFS